LGAVAIDHKSTRRAVEALLVVYTNVVVAMQKVIANLSYANLTTIVDSTTKDANSQSIQTILTYIISSGYSYAGYIRKLKKISDRVKGHSNYFSHHSSVDKEVREYVEYFAKNNNRQNFCISCTSTLELGIDIGEVDEVVQIDATHSIASLIQRVGRSGRKDGQSSNLFLYATNEWSLLQSLACWLLYKEGFIEPPQSMAKPYDILLHQALSITKGHSGILLADLKKQLKDNFAFNQIDISDIEEILNHLIEIDFLEKIHHEVIIGVEGEKIVNSRDFYSVFKSEENFKVINAGNTIGAIPFSPQIIEDENILLAAKIWKIKFIDFKSKKIIFLSGLKFYENTNKTKN
jgi:ATP-dependent Lhr-like helicase